MAARAKLVAHNLRELLLYGPTLNFLRAVAIGGTGSDGGHHIAVTADGTRVLVSDASRQLIEVVKIANEVVVQLVQSFSDAIATVPNSALRVPPFAEREAACAEEGRFVVALGGRRPRLGANAAPRWLLAPR